MAGKDDWRTVDVDAELSSERKAQYVAAKDAYRVYKIARDAFEQGMREDSAEHMPEGQELKFGYNFGKLSIALGPISERKVKASGKPKQSLADWLAGQGKDGHTS